MAVEVAGGEGVREEERETSLGLKGKSSGEKEREREREHLWGVIVSGCHVSTIQGA